MGDGKARRPSNSRVLRHAISKPKISAVEVHKNSLLKSLPGGTLHDDRGHSNSVKTLSCSEPRQAFRAQSPAQTRRLSPLERLPVEIFEIIFLQSLNFNLIRASPYLASKLSSFYVRRDLVIRTCSAHPPSVYPSAISPLFPNDKDLAEFQTALLRQKWMTLEFLRRCIPDYMTSTLLHEFQAHQLHWIDPKGPIVTPKSEATIREFVQQLFDIAITSSYEDAQQDIAGFEWVEGEDFSERTVNLFLGPREGLVVLRIDGNSHTYQSRYRILCLSMQCRIPDKLLHGPWSDDKCELLDIAVRGNATVNWISTTSGEVAETGFWDALKERNTNALRALIVGTSSEASFALPQTIHGVGVIPRQEHLVFAIQDGCREDIVDLLLNAPLSLVNIQQDEILRLLLAMEAQRHPQAQWLRGRMNSDRMRRLGRG